MLRILTIPLSVGKENNASASDAEVACVCPNCEISFGSFCTKFREEYIRRNKQYMEDNI